MQTWFDPVVGSCAVWVLYPVWSHVFCVTVSPCELNVGRRRVKWHVAKYPCSAFNPSKWTHTHREHTPGAVGSQCCGARGAVGGSVPCSRALQSWYWGWRERWSFTPPPPPTIPAGPETWTRDLWVTSPTLSIRPQLPRSASLEMLDRKSLNSWFSIMLRFMHLLTVILMSFSLYAACKMSVTFIWKIIFPMHTNFPEY